MRKLFSILFVALAAAGILSARSGMQSPTGSAAGEEKKIVDLKSDLMGPIAPGDSVLFLVGNFAAQHNGTVITCDSAVRYSDMHIEFFGNVLINKNTTYIYGDRAVYDGEINEARVYSDLIKVVDGDATLYTYQFVFNTKENIGEFYDGGVMTNRENVLEAVRGYYYSNTKELIGVDDVEMRNDEYELKGDSVVYNTVTDNAYFFERTNIWNNDGNYLYADRGSYHKLDTLYKVTRNGYVLTEKQEAWSDSMDYYRAKNHAVLRHNLQLDDTEHKALAFGDYGEYWKEPGNVFLTRRPSVISYDPSQGDSLFMRADSMWLFTRNRNAEKADSLAAQAALQSTETEKTDTPTTPKTPAGGGERPQLASDEPVRPISDTTQTVLPLQSEMPADSTQQVAVADSLTVAPADTVQLTPAQRKAQLKEAALKAKAEQKAAAAKARKEKLDTIAAKRRAKLQALKERDDKRLAAAKLKAESKLRARQARAARKGKVFVADSTELQRIDSLIANRAADSLTLLRDSLAADSLRGVALADSLAADSLATPADSIYRLLKGFHHVRMYRSDFQAVCDSMTAISTDSTIHLYIEPVLWNESNQITSDVMDIYTANQQITHANFVGSPMMVGLLDTAHYNQVAGKEMTAYFRDNQIYRNDVNGNAQTIYYMQDGEPPQITGVGIIESGDCSFFIEDKQVVTITYRKDPDIHIYPMNKIPADQSLFLKGFRWEGKRRPTQADVFDRTIRPSQRETRSALPHPAFPIRERIDRYRQQLIDQRRWFDRSDQVDAETVEWMRTLGYEVGKAHPQR